MFSREFSIAMFNALPDASAVLNAQGRIMAVNDAWKSFCAENGGNTETFYVGSNYIDTCLESAEAQSFGSATIADGLRKVIHDGETFRFEYPCHSDTERRWFEVLATLLVSKTGKYVFVSHRNITTRVEHKEEINRNALRRNELVALIATSSDAIMSFDLDGNVLTWNRAAENLYGYKFKEIEGRSLELIYPEDWPTPLNDYIARIITGEISHFDVIRKTKDGELKNVSISAAPIRDFSGEIVAISNIHRDITDRIRAEEHQKFISRELNHRTKNMFAVVSAIERQTAASSSTKEEFHEKFAARLASLMASNELLVSQQWQPVALHELCQAQLKPFSDDRTSEKISFAGPPVLLFSDAVQAMGLGLHELATNSAKYGALKSAQGSIELKWNLETTDSDARLLFTWRETGVQIDEKPKYYGFGHTVLTRLARDSLEAVVDLHFEQDQILWTVSMPPGQFRLE